jgi:hypothetical protein
MLVTGLLTLQTMFVGAGSVGIIHVPADYATIQAAIDAAGPLDVIVVEPGTYHEDINFRAKIITVSGSNPSDAATVAATVIDGSGTGTVVSFSGVEDGRALLTGITVTGGSASQGGGIHCHGAAPTIRRCRVVNNAGEGAGMYECHGIIEGCIVSENVGDGALQRCNGAIHDCAVTDNVGVGVLDCNGSIARSVISRNRGGIAGGGSGRIADCVISGNYGRGISGTWNSIVNCTVTGNAGYGVSFCRGPITNSILWDNWDELDSSTPPIYSAILGGGGGTGSIQSNPLFRSPGYWDYAHGGTWVDGDYRLSQSSPCIDAGDPLFLDDPDASIQDFDGNPRVVGPRVDIGAFEFQTAVCEGDDFDGDGTPDVCDPDIDGDGVPNVIDVCDFTPPGVPVDDQGRPRADLNLDCEVDLRDFAIFQNSMFGP